MRKAAFSGFSGYMLAGILLITACSEDKAGSHGPIVLGDSATIVTETDAQYLQDNVSDFQSRPVRSEEPVLSVKDTLRTVQVPKKDTPVPAAKPVAAKVDEKGLHIAFKPFSVFLPGIHARSFRQQDPATARGVSYSLESGKLEGNSLRIEGATVLKVVQRYQTGVILKDRDAGNMLLQSLGTYSSAWEPVLGSGTSYAVKGIGKGQLKYHNVSGASVQAAVRKAARSNRLSRKEEERLLKTVRNVRSATQAPLSIVLQSVIWKITVRDAAGKTVEKEVRLDMNAG